MNDQATLQSIAGQCRSRTVMCLLREGHSGCLGMLIIRPTDKIEEAVTALTRRLTCARSQSPFSSRCRLQVGIAPARLFQHPVRSIARKQISVGDATLRGKSMPLIWTCGGFSSRKNVTAVQATLRRFNVCLLVTGRAESVRPRARTMRMTVPNSGLPVSPNAL
jgi:hypothetical protein